jgi:uroporphyrinogen decarboxylase
MKRLQKAKIPAILHSDGDNRAFMDWIIATGFAVLNPIQPGPGDWNIYALKERYGHRIALWGNIDVADVLSQGTPEDVSRDTLEHLRRLAPGGGYICGSSHDISENIPFENFVAMARTVCSFNAKS